MLSFCPLPAVQHPDEPPCVSMRDRRENDRGNRDGEHFGRALRHFGDSQLWSEVGDLRSAMKNGTPWWFHLTVTRSF